MESLISLLRRNSVAYLEKDGEKLTIPSELKEGDLISMLKNKTIITDGRSFQFHWDNDWYKINYLFIDDTGRLKSPDIDTYPQLSEAVKHLEKIIFQTSQ